MKFFARSRRSLCQIASLSDRFAVRSLRCQTTWVAFKVVKNE